jgi:hypothetical protein
MQVCIREFVSIKLMTVFSDKERNDQEILSGLLSLVWFSIERLYQKKNFQVSVHCTICKYHKFMYCCGF